MKKRQLTEEQAAEVYTDRFSPHTTPRSYSYKWGFKENLRRLSFPDSPKALCPHSAGTAEFDAWFAGFDAADNSVACFWYRQGEAEPGSKD